MANHALFVGMVTHPRSRFHSAGLDAVHSLAAALDATGVHTEVLISDRDDYNAAVTPLRREVLMRSSVHQADLEHRWRRYLAAGGAQGARSAASDRLVRAGMAVRRLSRPGARAAAVRLLNIDLSHLRLMAAAVQSGSRWALILEDDAGFANAAKTAAALSELMDVLDSTPVKFANLSESLSPEELGIGGLLHLADKLSVDGPGVYRASRPITNTVCATLYRRDYVEVLRASIDHRGLLPVVPIDWRVNEVIMDLYDQSVLDESSCVWVRPGLFVQQSMHHPRQR